MTAATCGCACFGCAVMCEQVPPAWGASAHRARVRLALENSLMAELASRGAPCWCMDDAHLAACPMGLLTDRISDVAILLAAVLESPFGGVTDPPTGGTNRNRASEAFAALLNEIELALAGRPRVS